ncbi:MAG: peptidase M17, partial [Rhodopirellula bahusiensis]
MQPLPFPSLTLTAEAKLDLAKAGVLVLGVEPAGDSAESSGGKATAKCVAISALPESLAKTVQNGCDSGEVNGKPGELTSFATGDAQTPWIVLAGLGA